MAQLLPKGLTVFEHLNKEEVSKNIQSRTETNLSISSDVLSSMSKKK